MRRNLLKTGMVSLLLAVLLLGGYSCTDDYPGDSQIRRMIEEALRENNKQLEFTRWEIIPYEVPKSDWKWNSAVGRYEAVYELPQLDEFEFIYENGATLGYLFLGEQGQGEVQKLLPFVHTYQVDDADKTIYTETISFDVEYVPGGKSNVAFFIQNSNWSQAEEALANYNFRIVLIW